MAKNQNRQSFKSRDPQTGLSAAASGDTKAPPLHESDGIVEHLENQ